MKTVRLSVFRALLVALSLGFLSLATFAGLMHQWHRVFFISLNGLDYSFGATLGFLLAGIACWMLAGLLLNDEPG
jgi:biotin transporter BioY